MKKMNEGKYRVTRIARDKTKFIVQAHDSRSDIFSKMCRKCLLPRMISFGIVLGGGVLFQ